MLVAFEIVGLMHEYSYLYHRRHACELWQHPIQQWRLRSTLRQLCRLHPFDKPSIIPLRPSPPRTPRRKEALREGRRLASLRKVSARHQHPHSYASINLEEPASHCKAHYRLRVANVRL